VHGAGGTLLEHFKEHALHCDLKPVDRLFFQTSCGWMMWNWQLSALATGAGLVLYDGPLDGPETLWNVVDQQQVTVFGTNPAYLQFCQDSGFKPCDSFQLSDLRAMLSTGSILYPSQFDWVRESVKRLPLQSISGGTDIIGCFVLGNPNLPVHRGEAQCRSLGMDVRSIAPDHAGIGELVCANPFPSRPLGFLDDPDGKRFHDAYFSQHDGVWTHGDLIEFTARGGAVLHGRNDGVINIRGVRIGPAEIYRILQDHPAVIEAMAVEQQAEDEPGGARLVLLVVLRGELDGPLVASIRRMLASRGSSAMVPARILQVNELPVTHSGKRSEAAARDAVNLRPIRNRDALRNPECLDRIAAQMVSPSELKLHLESSQTLDADLLRACQDWLGAPISPTDDLLSLGVDSLSMLGLLMRLEQRFGYEISLGSFEPTVQGIAAAVSGRTNSPTALVRVAGPDDASDVCRLLHEGFPNVESSSWHCLFTYSWDRSPPDRGYVLVGDKRIVGFLGTVYAEREINGKHGVVCNLTSWYIRPGWRGWGGAMLNRALQDHTKTYTVFTPSPLPKQMFEMLNFTSLGDTVALPPLRQPGFQRGPLIVCEPDQVRAYLDDVHRRIFDHHAGYDCLALVAAEPDGYAFMVLKRRFSSPHRLVPSVPTSRMIYCSNPTLLMRCAEHIKMAIMRKQRTFAVLVNDNWLPQRLHGIRTKARSLFRSPVFSAHELDMLYSEIVLLPV
jgi:acetoacetyl-CoA synthetase